MPKIKGTVTRVVTKDLGPLAVERANAVFFRPTDPADLRTVDGSKRAGLDEIRVEFPGADDVKPYTVGGDIELDV